MKLIVGNYYKVKMGGVVKIEYNSNELGYPYHNRPFFGRVVNTISTKVSFKENHIRACFFSINGKYNLERESEFDITEDITDNYK